MTYMNKKIIATAMSVFMIFGIAGCSADKDTAKEIEAIKQDEVNNNPLSNMNFDYGKEDDLDE